MRKPRIYQPLPLAVDSEIQLTTAGAHHVSKVLRMQQGDSLIVFNGEGGEFTAQIVAADKKNVRISISAYQADTCAPRIALHLGQVISRGERMDYALQKAVELGVTEITPLFSQRCEVKLHGSRLEKRQQQWQHLIISACEQCGLNRPPTLHPAIPIANWWSGIDAPLKWVLHPGEVSLKTLLKQPQPASVCLAIGPEGGFDPQEINAAQRAGFQAASIGPRIFRTETAPVVALSLLQYQWGDF